jgi:hypothetical protein
VSSATRRRASSRSSLASLRSSLGSLKLRVLKLGVTSSGSQARKLAQARGQIPS